MSDWLTLLPFLAAVVIVAASGALFMPGAWYKTLDKPVWTPPDWLFGPAWTILYVLIAIAGWRVWSVAGFATALVVWCVNLAFNAAWSWLMFGKRRMDLALADAIAMLITIVAFIALALPRDRTAAYLFVPYLVWVLYATALNWSILRRNPNSRGPAESAGL